MPERIVLVLIDAQHDGEVLIGGRSRDDDLLDGRAQVRLGFASVGEVAGGFDDNLRAHLGPGQLGRIALGEDLDLLSVDGDVVRARGNLVLQVAKDRIVLEQVGQRRRTGQVVDGDKINLGIAQRGAQNIASNAAEAVDTDLNCHLRVLLRSR